MLEKDFKKEYDDWERGVRDRTKKYNPTRRERNHWQGLVLRLLRARPVSFNPELAKALGSAKAGLFISQLLYWKEKGINKEWTYKTIKEIEKETSLTREEQDRAIRICKSKGFLKVKLKGVPAKRHFNLDFEKLMRFLEEYCDKQDFKELKELERLKKEEN